MIEELVEKTSKDDQKDGTVFSISSLGAFIGLMKEAFT
jgi:hypothetical protein